MKLYWRIAARQSYFKIAAFIKLNFGRSARDHFVETVKEWTDLLCKHPEMGAIDPLFADRPETYRYVIIANRSRMVYRIIENSIFVLAFWDCRRDPESQAKKVE